MERIEKISVLQVIVIFVICKFFFSFSFLPTVSMKPANQDAWISELLSGVMVAIFCIPLLVLAAKFQNRTFHENMEIIFGGYIGKMMGILIFLQLVFIAFVSSIFIVDFLKSAVFIKTPFYVLVISMIVPCIYAAYKGIECMGRAAMILGPVIILIIIFYLLMNISNMEFKHFLPVLADSSASDIGIGAFNNAARFHDGIIFFMFIPYFQKSKKYSITRILLITILLFTILNMIITVATQAVLTPNFAKIFRSPYYVSLQHINVYNFIQRIEFFNVIAWILVFITKISVTIIAASLEMAQIVKAKSYKSFIIPTSILIFISIVSTNISNVPNFKVVIYDYAYIIIFTAFTVVPSIMLLVYYLRRKSIAKWISLH